MKLSDIDVMVEERSDGYENYRGPSSFYFCCKEEGCRLSKPHPNAFSLSLINTGDENTEIEISCNRVDEIVRTKLRPMHKTGIGNALVYFQKKAEGYCMDPNHPSLYSSKNDRYFCPFCND